MGAVVVVVVVVDTGNTRPGGVECFHWPCQQLASLEPSSEAIELSNNLMRHINSCRWPTRGHKEGDASRPGGWRAKWATLTCKCQVEARGELTSHADPHNIISSHVNAATTLNGASFPSLQSGIISNEIIIIVILISHELSNVTQLYACPLLSGGAHLKLLGTSGGFGPEEEFNGVNVRVASAAARRSHHLMNFRLTFVAVGSAGPKCNSIQFNSFLSLSASVREVNSCGFRARRQANC